MSAALILCIWVSMQDDKPLAHLQQPFEASGPRMQDNAPTRHYEMRPPELQGVRYSLYRFILFSPLTKDTDQVQRDS